MRFVLAVATSLTLLSALPAAAAPAKAAAKKTTQPAEEPAPASNGGGGFDLSTASVGGYLGGEFGDADGWYLRFDGSMPIMPLTPDINLRGVGVVGFTRFAEDIPYGEASTNVFKVLGAGRAQMTVAPQFEAYADLGIGFYFYSSKYDASYTDPVSGLTVSMSGDDSGGGLTMRVAAGGLYEINPKTKIGAELGFNPYFGDVDTTEFFIGVGFEYKL
jgi:hypothetical protein